MTPRRPVVAVDAVGGDNAPAAAVAGALRAVDELDVSVLLVGPEDVVKAELPDGAVPDGVEILHASEIVAMDDEPASAVRTKKDSSLVRAAEAVRDGDADAMVSAGNTGATMAAALLRMGRVSGVARPAVAVPIPVPGGGHQMLVDAGATVDCSPEWLAQFAVMGRTYSRVRFGVDEPRVGLLSNGEEAGKGDTLRKEATALLAGTPGFVGNVEGRQFMTSDPDVVVTDGFTGNVALKTIEGVITVVAGLVYGVLSATDEAREAGRVIEPLLLEAAETLDPEHTGGATLLGVDGVCIISHGSSTDRAIAGAVGVALDAVAADVPTRIGEAIAGAR
ncbi:MAG: phosphate acyltransferase PlsX [Acidimicrobiia bacterium]